MNHRSIGWPGLDGTLKSNCIYPYSALPAPSMGTEKSWPDNDHTSTLDGGDTLVGCPPSASGQRWCFISTVHKRLGSAWRKKEGQEEIDSELGARLAGIIHCTEERGKAGTGISATLDPRVGTWPLSNPSHKTPWHKLSRLLTFLTYSLRSSLMPMKAQETVLPLL